MFIQKMNRISVLALAFCSVAMITSCKSSESAYKKAYEKAQAQAAQSQTTTTTTATPAPQVQIAPVQTQTPVDVSNENVRTENVTLVSGSGLKDYSVVCGSFTLQANAEGLQQTLKSKGYDAQVVSSNVNGRKWFRVAASTFADKASAVQSRNKLRSAYPDAWVLLKK